MQYSLSAGGKRIRPILCMASAEAVGGSADTVVHAACALEMIHTYSLVHDDLPAMDDDALRRGKPTAHIQFDEATAILSGDALLTLAFQVLSDPAYTARDSLKENLKVIHVIARAAGYDGMVAGQMLDMLSEGSRLALSDLERMHLKKTGALIEASVIAGAVLAKAAQDQLQALRRFARLIGLAFQVMDDILNVKGDPAKMGKAVGTDVNRRKSTYPSILGLSESENYAQKLVEKSLTAIACFDKQADPLRAISRYIVSRSR
jgi:geranylgeranyl diphosphate synthase type II